MVCPTDMVQHTAVVDGVFVVKKEAGWTSHDVVAKVRGLLGGVKVGHAGTLDPSATGVLPLLVGRATRVAEYLVEWDKEYRARLRLGETTDTQDATGTVLERIDTNGVDNATLHEVIARFHGPQKQLPPMYSAVKVEGRPLYKAARAGETVRRTERDIVIHALDIVAVEGRDVTLNIVCSKGTYIRTLCADIGQALGVGGHLLTLERRRVGPLAINQALTVDQVAAHLAIGTLRDHLITLDQALERLPAVAVNGEEALRVMHGASIAPVGVERFVSPAHVRLKDESGRLLAIGSYDGVTAGLIKVRKVLMDPGSLN